MENYFKADLHCHSNCSDGTLSPREILTIAKEIGLSGLSITDHDTVNAYPETLALGQEFGVEILPGIEFSAVQDEDSVHILCYLKEWNHPQILQLCERHRLRREKRNRAILDLLNQHQMPLKYEDIAETAGTIGRPHIAKAMMAKGYVSSINEAFKKYLRQGKCCYARVDSITVRETLDIIHQAKGAAVIAHPHLIEKRATLKKLYKFPFDGIECYYALMPLSVEKKWIQLAEDKNLLITGGSDFHGSVKPHIPLGASWVDEFHFGKLQNKISL